MQSPKFLQEATAKNLPMKLNELVKNGEVVDITDPALHKMAINAKLNFKSK